MNSFNLRGHLCPSPLTDQGQIWHIETDPQPTLTCQFFITQCYVSMVYAVIIVCVCVCVCVPVCHTLVLYQNG